MATYKNKPGTNRREFLAGAAFSLGAVAGFTGCTLPTQALKEGIPSAGRLEHNASLCAGCGVCSLMCSLYHEKEVNISLSRSELVRDPLEATFSVSACPQAR